MQRLRCVPSFAEAQVLVIADDGTYIKFGTYCARNEENGDIAILEDPDKPVPLGVKLRVKLEADDALGFDVVAERANFASVLVLKVQTWR